MALHLATNLGMLSRGTGTVLAGSAGHRLPFVLLCRSTHSQKLRPANKDTFSSRVNFFRSSGTEADKNDLSIWSLVLTGILRVY